MTSAHLSLRTLPHGWTIRDFDADFYASQKRIRLSAADEICTTPDPLKQGGDMTDLWQRLVAPRLASITTKSKSVPTLFPGRSVALRYALNESNNAYDRYRALISQKLISGEPISLRTPKRVTEAFVLDTFRTIHFAWSQLEPPTYDEQTVELIVRYLSTRHAGSRVWFELEEFASYNTLRNSLNLIASGFQNRNWIDIASQPLINLRGTEACTTDRILQELDNILHGRIAPLVINEFGCVSDGNHRLTAAWIWHLLHLAHNFEWHEENIEFTSFIASILNHHRTIDTQFVLSSAKAQLEAILSEPVQAIKLQKFKHEIAAYDILALPVVPMLAYNNFALEREVFERTGEFKRFNPTQYADLRTDADRHFKSRACLHFADRSPLPWFSLIQPCTTIHTYDT